MDSMSENVPPPKVRKTSIAYEYVDPDLALARLPSINDILNSHPFGKTIVQNYKKRPSLTEYDRKKIVEYVADEVLEISPK